MDPTEKIDRKKIIENFKQIQKEDTERTQKEINDFNTKIKEETKMRIISYQNEFLLEIKIQDIKLIKIYTFATNYFETNYFSIENFEGICYTIEYNNGEITDIKHITEKIFNILYTKPHFIEFCDGYNIIHFLHI